MNNSHKKKNTEIEYLRAYAILFTLIHHIVLYLVPAPQNSNLLVNIYSRFSFWTGVDLFFCISGFVIAKSFYEKNVNHINIQSIYHFWLKRFFRLLPSAWLWIVIYLGLTAFYNRSGAFGDITQNLQDMKAAFLQYANYYGLSCWGQNANLNCGPNGIFWSLSLEEQFYFIFPVLIYIFRKHVPYILGLSVIIPFFIDRPVWSSAWAFRFDGIALGVLIYLFTKTSLHKKIEPLYLFNKNRLNVAIKFCMTMTFLFLLSFLAKATHLTFNYLTLIALINGFMIWLASYNKDYTLKFKSSSWIHHLTMWLASRSYSIYLIHIVTFKLSYEVIYQLSPYTYTISNDSMIYLLPLGLLFTFVCSELNYRYIENPIKNYFYKTLKIG